MSYDQLSLTALMALILTTSLPIANLPPLFQGSQVLAQSPADRKAEADRLFVQGIEQANTIQFRAALQSWQQALKIYQEIKDRKGEGGALANLANIYKALENYPKIIEYYKEYLPIARETKNRKGESDALFNIGLAYASLQDYTKAIEYYEQGLPIAREIKDHQNEFYTLGNLGITYLQLKNYRKAIEYEQQYLAIAQKIKDLPRELQGLKLLAVAYQGLSDFPKALEFSQQGLAIAKEIKDRNEQGQLQGLLGMVYLNLRDYPKAVESNKQSLAIAREFKSRDSEGNALDNLGNAYMALGDYPKAMEYYQQSLAIAREIKDRSTEHRTLNGLASAYMALGDYPKAMEYYQQNLAIAREIKDDLGEIIALGNIGLVYMLLGDYPKGIEYFQQELTNARKIKDPFGEKLALKHFAFFYLLSGDYPKAIEYFQQELTNARKIKDTNGKSFALNNLGLAFYKQGNLTLAESNLIEAIKFQESLRAKELKDIEKIPFYDTQRNAYETLQKVLIAQNKTDAALEIAERGRGRAFVELLASRIFSNPKEQSPTPPTITEIKQIAKQQNSTLVQYSIISSDEFKEGKQLAQELELYIWVIKPTGEVTFRKADLKPLWQKENTTLAKLVITSRNSIGARGTSFRGIKVTYNPNTPKAKNNLKRLHELLINPIADLLPKNSNDRVIFIPQSSLFLVPFAALQDSDGKYLIEKHTILTSPSIQVLDLTHKQRQRIGTQPIQGKDTLIVGNPTMPFLAPKIGETPQQLIPLPGAEREANAISKLLKTEPLMGNKATEATVVKRLPEARFVHLATHGLFDDIQGLNSGIALTPSGKDDGLLTASEILDLKLNVELVVLSACDTGRGRISGDGVIGLSRSLISAGVSSVLVSLWSVPDAPTALLMTEFYQNIQKGSDKAQALRQAMMTTMKNNPNPVDWAAFTLIGEAE
ncbi:MAG: CHAT domain-containing protein [Cyanomargarita calcarea GSE-NOS-MK-12-04C]|jgi:CHAT domain-containing protein/Flp pilus assembly protein TadD|uniref:CHAT domain-containing protein n=1 Tax=Cyanomargarita calcarea GSE-NOS-MK-12-04C TaxID=2839659 RepID=A0A951UVM5_9CYAN|nr:CHAT domain-containing protein [Cyanomargarita calcarea GSE-NOS-MK-12-04C]